VDHGVVLFDGALKDALKEIHMNTLDWNEYHKQVLAGVGNIGRMGPDGTELAVAVLPHANELGESHG
jgi:hypothetical protein